MVFILLPVIIIIVSLVWYSMKPVQINTVSITKPISEYPRVFFGDKSQLQFCYFMRDISLPMNLREYTKSLLATNLCQKFQSTIFQKILGLLWKIGNHEQAWTVGNHFASSEVSTCNCCHLVNTKHIKAIFRAIFIEFQQEDSITS